MTSSKKFPTFASHDRAFCFNCEGDLDGTWISSGYPKGEFVQSCEKCGMSTWYDMAMTEQATVTPAAGA